MSSTIRVLAAVAAAALASCGGGIVPDPQGTSPDVRLACGVNGCVSSNTLSAGSITALMYVVDDGSRTQAQAGFNTDGSIFHNVELEGDTLWVDDGATQRRMLLAREGAWDFFQNLLTLGQPYLADIAPQPSAARSYEFQLRRAGGTVASQVTLPAPFTIGAPGNDQVFAIGSSAVPITVSAPLNTGNFSTTFFCTDANGNQTSNRVPTASRSRRWATAASRSSSTWRPSWPAWSSTRTSRRPRPSAAATSRCMW
jgi:hypothetical protein